MVDVAHASTTRHGDWGGPKRWLRIVLHDTVEEFHEASYRYCKHIFKDADKDTVACFHPPLVPELWNAEEKRMLRFFPKHYAGMLRFNREWLTNETITHECVHAGAMIYRMDIHEPFNLGVTYNKREEHLAYIVGDLANNVFAAIKEIE